MLEMDIPYTLLSSPSLVAAPISGSFFIGIGFAVVKVLFRIMLRGEGKL